ncbi:MAG: nitroreductase family protein [Chitinivibrionales bacterium]|nr:nitroreductase family protein [Chitinivibrionales bacterium]
MVKKSIDYDKCTSCMACERICANSRVIRKNDQGKPEFAFDFKCVYCGHCLAICPEKAITFEPLIPDSQTDCSYRSGALPIDSNDQEQDESVVRQLLNATRSNRFFLNRTVERETINKVLDTMVRAPSAGNEQNRNFYILDDKKRLSELEDQLRTHFFKLLAIYKNPVFVSSMAMSLAMKTRRSLSNRQTHTGQQDPGKPGLSVKALYRANKKVFQDLAIDGDAHPMVYLHDAPVVIIVTTGPRSTQIHKGFYKSDAGIAATYGTLMAKGLGLSTCLLGLLEIAVNKNKEIRQSLGIGEHERVDAALALGYSDLVWHQIPPRGPVKVVWNNTKEGQA